MVNPQRWKEVNPTVVRSALKITSAYATNCEAGFSVVTQHLKLEHISQHVASSDEILRYSALNLYNALLRKAPNVQCRNEIFAALVCWHCFLGCFFVPLNLLFLLHVQESHRVIESLAESVRKSLVDEALAHELYVLQTLWLTRLSSRREYFFNAEDKVG